MPKIEYRMPKVGDRLGGGVVDKVVDDETIIVTLEDVRTRSDGYQYNQVVVKPFVTWHSRGIV